MMIAYNKQLFVAYNRHYRKTLMFPVGVKLTSTGLLPDEPSKIMSPHLSVQHLSKPICTAYFPIDHL
eukprot:scaffold4819_cov83-Skeletonema_menzelii.AAC.2